MDKEFAKLIARTNVLHSTILYDILNLSDY